MLNVKVVSEFQTHLGKITVEFERIENEIITDVFLPVEDFQKLTDTERQVIEGFAEQLRETEWF